MTDSDSYLSKDRDHLNKGQRQRRARNPRIDYYPSQDALAVIEAKRGRWLPWNNKSGILDAIVTQWADLTGIKYRKVENAKSSVMSPEIDNQYARTSDFGAKLGANATDPAPLSGITAHFGQARARELSTVARAKKNHVICGASARTGKPCRGKSLPGKRRCKWHGGCSTGPRTDAGKAKAKANLKQFRPPPGPETSQGAARITRSED